MSSPHPCRRRALSLVELLVALCIMGVSVASIAFSLSAGRQHARRLDVSATGQFLALSVMEQAISRWENADRRFFRLATTPPDLVAAAARGDWKKPFLALAAPRQPVLGGVAYFDPGSGPVIPAAMDEPERRFYSAFSYEVRVGFDVPLERDGPRVPLDANGDGQPEVDLGAIEVDVHFTPPDGSPEWKVCGLRSLVAAPDRAPGATALTQR
jgi:type II secretory pathway pseudopilin PulG